MPHLVLQDPNRVSIEIPITNGVIVGRHDEARVVLPYADVSRRHARFDVDIQGVMVRDLGSRSGTYVNGVRVSEAQLQPGDIVRIGPTKLVFAAEDAASTENVIQFKSFEQDTQAASDPRLQLVFEIVQSAFTDGNPEELLGRMLDSILRVLGAERAVAALRENDDLRSLRYVVRMRNLDDSSDSQPTLGVDVLNSLLERKSIIIRHERSRPMSAMGVPMQLGRRFLGFLYVDDRSRQAPFNRDDLDFLVALASLTCAALDSAERHHRAAAMAEASSSRFASDLLGQSAATSRLKEQIRRYAPSSGTHVLVHGESGTGKELVARALHAASPRAKQAFIALNCAAIPESMIEGELFGYEKDAFTGALRDRRGRFALAHRGTLLLDEIGDLSLAAQAKVLRATQYGEIHPLGAEHPINVDVRIIATTHKDLHKEVAAGRFREDLYFRLKVVDIHVPPLREREADVLLLAQSFVEAMALNVGKSIRGFSPAAKNALIRHGWPGNVRELKNEIERAVLHADGEIIDVDDFGPHVWRSLQNSLSDSANGTSLETPGKPSIPNTDSEVPPLALRYAALDDLERALVEEALQEARGNLAEGARLLGITRIMLRRRVERYGLRTREE